MRVTNTSAISEGFKYCHSAASTSVALMATSATTMTTASTASNVASVLKRPTTLALRTKSAPRNPKCSFLSSNKCLYHNTTASSNSGKKGDWSERKSNIFVKLTSLRKDTAGVITSVALKATVSKRDSCDLEADKVKDEVTIVNSTQCEYFIDNACKVLRAVSISNLS